MRSARLGTLPLNPLRILMLSPQYRPIVGGYERAAERLSAALAVRGHSVTVIAERRHQEWPAKETIDGVEVRRLWCAYRPRLHSLTALASFALFLLTQGRRFDVWHVHQYGYHAALAVALGTLLHRPVVLKLTSTAAMGIENAMGSGITRRILRFFHRRVSGCVATTEEARAEAIGFGIPADRIRNIANGVDGRQFHPASLEERRAARLALGLHCRRLVLFVGRLSPEKNPLGLLDAWAAVDTAVREGSLLALLGDGTEWDKVHAKVEELHLAGSIHLAGRQTNVPTWYQAADLYVIASHNEGLSNAMIEALASGLSVVSTAVSGAAKYIQATRAGILVPVGDMAALASAIQRALLSPDDNRLFGLNARRTFEDHLAVETVAKQTDELYRLICRQGRATK